MILNWTAATKFMLKCIKKKKQKTNSRETSAKNLSRGVRAKPGACSEHRSVSLQAAAKAIR